MRTRSRMDDQVEEIDSSAISLQFRGFNRGGEEISVHSQSQSPSESWQHSRQGHGRNEPSFRLRIWRWTIITIIYIKKNTYQLLTSREIWMFPGRKREWQHWMHLKDGKRRSVSIKKVNSQMGITEAVSHGRLLPRSSSVPSIVPNNQCIL